VPRLRREPDVETANDEVRTRTAITEMLPLRSADLGVLAGGRTLIGLAMAVDYHRGCDCLP
jgi:hypothetical protein